MRLKLIIKKLFSEIVLCLNTGYNKLLDLLNSRSLNDHQLLSTFEPQICFLPLGIVPQPAIAFAETSTIVGLGVGYSGRVLPRCVVVVVILCVWFASVYSCMYTMHVWYP